MAGTSIVIDGSSADMESRDSWPILDRVPHSAKWADDSRCGWQAKERACQRNPNKIGQTNGQEQTGGVNGYILGLTVQSVTTPQWPYLIDETSADERWTKLRRRSCPVLARARWQIDRFTAGKWVCCAWKTVDRVAGRGRVLCPPCDPLAWAVPWWPCPPTRYFQGKIFTFSGWSNANLGFFPWHFFFFLQERGETLKRTSIMPDESCYRNSINSNNNNGFSRNRSNSNTNNNNRLQPQNGVNPANGNGSPELPPPVSEWSVSEYNLDRPEDLRPKIKPVLQLTIKLPRTKFEMQMYNVFIEIS